jgi:hypothetical protein
MLQNRRSARPHFPRQLDPPPRPPPSPEEIISRTQLQIEMNEGWIRLYEARAADPHLAGDPDPSHDRQMIETLISSNLALRCVLDLTRQTMEPESEFSSGALVMRD